MLLAVELIHPPYDGLSRRVLFQGGAELVDNLIYGLAIRLPALSQLAVDDL